MIPLLFGAIAAAVAAAAIDKKDSEEATSGDWGESLGDWSIELGKRIETSRVLQRMTQEKCAAAANISRTALRNLEDGKDTKLSTIFAVSNALSLPMTAVFKGMQPDLEEALSKTLRE